MASEAGKGDKRRKGADDKAYAEGWDRIFRRPQEQQKDTQEELKKEQAKERKNG